MDNSKSVALYRKWRPSTLEQVLGQPFAQSVLKGQIAQGRVSHAYLLVGPRGTGKTTIGRLIAMAVSCLREDKPCGECEFCLEIQQGEYLDLIEIDAASNNGVDSTRVLTSTASFLPQEGNYKIFIIDEFHMLTRHAMNALLKTLEEPPENVIFCLCTTDEDAVLDTIRSRCQKIQMGLIPANIILSQLQKITDKEKFDIPQETLELLSRRANGSMRDGISLLETISMSTTKSKEFVMEVVFGIDTVVVDAIIACIEERNISKVTVIMGQGKFITPAAIVEVMAHYHDQLIGKRRRNYSIKDTAYILERLRAAYDLIIRETIPVISEAALFKELVDVTAKVKPVSDF